MFKYYLDNNLVNNPLNWKDFEEVLEYDIENNTFLYSYPLSLKFHGDEGYQYLLSKNDVDGCSIVSLKIEQNICGNYKLIFLGNIFISDLTINRHKCIIEAPVQENGFTSFLNNNKSIKVQIREDASAGTNNYSKNGIDIGSTLNIDVVLPILFNPFTGTYSVNEFTTGFYIYDCFKFLVAYLSDLEITFESNFLDRTQSFVLPKDNVKRLVLTNGNNIYWGAQNLSGAYEPFTTLQELLEEVNRFYPIGYYMKYDFNNNPVFCIEDLDFFLNSNQSVAFNTINSIEEKRATGVYYSNITIGGNNVEYDGGTFHGFQPEEMYTFKEENYLFGLQCNIDKVKNLKGKYFIDSNIIQELAYTNQTNAYATYADNNFFIEVLNSAGSIIEYTYKIANSNNLSYHYNENLINSHVIDRFDNFGDIYFNSFDNPNTLVNASDKAYLKILSFNKAISDQDYELIKANLSYKIGINIDSNGTLGSGWIKRMQRKFATGESQIELRV